MRVRAQVDWLPGCLNVQAQVLKPGYREMPPWASLFLPLPHCDPYPLFHYDPVLPPPPPEEFGS